MIKVRQILVIACVAGFSFMAQAQWITGPTNLLNINFDGEPYGTYSANGLQLYTGVQGDLLHTTFNIADVPGMSKGVIVDNQSVGDWGSDAYVDQYPFGNQAPSVFNERAIYSFDINQLVNTVDVEPYVLDFYHNTLGGLSTNVNAGWETAINSFISGVGGSVWRFTLVATSASTGNFMLQSPDLSLFTIGTFTTGTTYHVEIDNYFLSSKYDVSIDGVRVATQVPFKAIPSSTNAQFNEIFAYNWNAGTGDQVVTAFDNFSYTLIPEPSPILLGSIGLITSAVIFRRMRRKA